MAWALAVTHPNVEHLACADFRRLNFQHLWFKLRSRVLLRGHVVSRITSAFPRYIFVQAEQAWDAARAVWRVAGLVAFGGELALVSDQEIEARIAACGGGDILPAPVIREPFSRGERVHVTGYGPMSGHDGLYEEIAGNDKLRLLFDWMGRSVPIDIDARDVHMVRAPIELRRRKHRRGKRGHRVHVLKASSNS